MRQTLATKMFWLKHAFASLALACGLSAWAQETPKAPPRPVEGIRDNSFLIEEAYNQEEREVQHIFNALYGLDRAPGSDDEAWNLVFTQEWPVFSRDHQFSYTIPYNFARSGGEWDDGVGDVLLNYRYQALYREDTLTAVAPRFSLVLPTGDEDDGFGAGTVGYQFNLPFSTAIRDNWFLHLNAGMTFLPEAGPRPERDLTFYNFGASAIYALTHELHFLVEWLGNYNHVVESTGVRDREFSSVISPGFRKAINFANDSQLVLGIAAPIGLTGPAPDIGVFLYVSFEHLLGK